jgi:urease accessory protein
MTDSMLVLRLLQDGDSFFPSGAVSFSWGLETLCADGVVSSGKDLKSFVLAQLSRRWLHFDRPIIVAAAQPSVAVSTLMEIDQIVEAQTLCAELRSSSRRGGNGLLTAHIALETEGAQEYYELVQNGYGKGHLAPMQGFLWARRGIPPQEAAILSAHTLCIGLLGAAVRIGVIGNTGAQKILMALHCEIEPMLQLPLADFRQVYSFMPQAEIASMRHEEAEVRMFAN